MKSNIHCHKFSKKIGILVTNRLMVSEVKGSPRLMLFSPIVLPEIGMDVSSKIQSISLVLPLFKSLCRSGVFD